MAALRASARTSWIAAAVIVCASRSTFAQSDGTIELIVEKGRPLRVALTGTTTVRRVGQAVEGTLVEPVFAYDRVVLPAGARVIGHIATLESPGRMSRARAWLSGDISPHRTIALEFDAVVRDGETVLIKTIVTGGAARVRRQVSRDMTDQQDDSKGGAVARAKQDAKGRAAAAAAAVKQKASDTIAAIKEPGRMARLKAAAVDRLPYHPQFLRQGTVYDAELRAPIRFGRVPPRRNAPAGTLPPPSSVLHARLTSTLDSAKVARGAPLEAFVSEPVFADDGRVIFPEGTRLTGEVTFAEPARRFHRNGRLRFLFERVEPPDQDSAPLLASLHAVDASVEDHVVLDEEGGAAVKNSNGRFVTPALAILALRASLDEGEGRGFERGANGVGARTTSASVERGHPLARGLGGLIGFGVVGAVLGPVSRPLGIAFAVAGAGRSVYANVFGKGQDVRFHANTPIQVRLAPGPSNDP